jgi:hypothetical protein
MSLAVAESAEFAVSVAVRFCAVDGKISVCTECDAENPADLSVLLGASSPLFRKCQAKPTPSTSTTAVKHNFLRRLTIPSTSDAAYIIRDI